MVRALYTAGIKAYGFGIRIAALWNRKASKWTEGRRKSPDQNAETIIEKPLWIHCASVGEFEQGRPIIEHFKSAYPGLPILLTFFSPSGYEMRKDYPLADVVCYIPVDTMSAMGGFLNHFQPRIAVFVKYDIWHNCLFLLSQKKIPSILVSAAFRPDQVYFKAWGGWFAKSLQYFDHIYTQDAPSKNLLQSIGVKQASVAGDTRFDRVLKIAESLELIPAIEKFKSGHHIVVAGSTWGPDEVMLRKWWYENSKKHQNWKLILVPHELSELHIARLTKQFPNSKKWSTGNFQDADVLIVDAMGILNRLYYYADVAYVGGGFGRGIHNVLEAAVYGCPVVFGPEHKKFNEAMALLAEGGAISGQNEAEVLIALGKLSSDNKVRNLSGTQAANYVKRGKGATELITIGISTLLQKL